MCSIDVNLCSDNQSEISSRRQVIRQTMSILLLDRRNFYFQQLFIPIRNAITVRRCTSRRAQVTSPKGYGPNHKGYGR